MSRVTLTLILVAGLAMLVVLALLNATASGQAQGRYLFPGLAGFAALSAWAAFSLLPPRVGWRLAVLLAALLFLGNVTALVGTLVPAYSGPPSGRLSRLETSAGPLIVQHAPPAGDEPTTEGFHPDRWGRWLVSTPGGNTVPLDLAAELLGSSRYDLVAPAASAPAAERPQDLPGIAAVECLGLERPPSRQVRPG